MYEKKCPVCEKPFSTKLAFQIYCCKKCARKAYRDRPKNKKAIKKSIDVWIGKNRERYLNGKQAYREENREKRKKQQREILRKLKKTTILKYGGKCECCGEKKLEFLTIDHINGGGTKHRKKVGGGGAFYYWLRRNNYPSGYRVLCSNCNSSYGSYGYCPHKTNKNFLEIK